MLDNCCFTKKGVAFSRQIASTFASFENDVCWVSCVTDGKLNSKMDATHHVVQFSGHAMYQTLQRNYWLS